MRNIAISILALGLVGGLSLGCSDEGTGGPIPVTGGNGNGDTGGGSSVEGSPVPFSDGWAALDQNTVGIQGAIFEYADDTTSQSLVANINMNGAQACISGTAAKVDLTCTPPDGGDCYGQYWGAAIGLNLNQPIDPATGMGADPPLEYDATANGVTGLAFDLSGSTVPSSMRFGIETTDGEFCTTSATPVLSGTNSIKFADLRSACWGASGMPAPGFSNLKKVQWQVVTNDRSEIPFDYCVSNLVALK